MQDRSTLVVELSKKFAKVGRSLCVTDDWVSLFEDVQDTLGEGPSLDALRTAEPVICESWDEQSRRWPVLMRSMPASVGGATDEDQGHALWSERDGISQTTGMVVAQVGLRPGDVLARDPGVTDITPGTGRSRDTSGFCGHCDVGRRLLPTALCGLCVRTPARSAQRVRGGRASPGRPHL